MEDRVLAAQAEIIKPEAPGVLWHGRYSVDERETMIREAAYYRYLQRGCVPGHEMEDWLAAEEAINHGTAAPPAGRHADIEVQQSGVHGAAEDDALKRLVKQHPQKAIPQVESVEPAQAPFRQ
jgi:hypothetical protein